MKATQTSHASDTTLDVSDDTLVFPAAPAAPSATEAFANLHTPAGVAAPRASAAPSVFNAVNPFVRQPLRFHVTKEEAPSATEMLRPTATPFAQVNASPAIPLTAPAQPAALAAEPSSVVEHTTQQEQPVKPQKDMKAAGSMPRFQAWAPPEAIPVSTSNVHALLMHAQQLSQKPDVMAVPSAPPAATVTVTPLPPAANEAYAPTEAIAAASPVAPQPSTPFKAADFKTTETPNVSLTPLVTDNFPEVIAPVPTLEKPPSHTMATKEKPQPHRLTSLYQKQPPLSAGYAQKSLWQRTPTAVRYGAIALGIVSLHAMFMYFVGQDTALQTYRDAPAPVAAQAAATQEAEIPEIPVVSEITSEASVPARQALAEPVLDLDSPVTPKAKPPAAVKSTLTGVKHNPSKAVPIKDVMVTEVASPSVGSVPAPGALPLLLPEVELAAPAATRPVVAPVAVASQPAAQKPPVAPIAKPTIAAVAPTPTAVPAAKPAPKPEAVKPVAHKAAAPKPAAVKAVAEKKAPKAVAKVISERPKRPSAAALAAIKPAASPVIQAPADQQKVISPFVNPSAIKPATTQAAAAPAPMAETTAAPTVVKRTQPITIRKAPTTSAPKAASAQDELLRLLNKQ